MSEPELHVVVGAGPVGRAVVGELAARGIRVRSFSRHRTADLPGGVEIVAADVTDPVEARRAMAGAGVIYHAASAAYHRWPDLLPPLMRGVLADAVATGGVVDHSKFARAFGADVTPHPEAIDHTLAWYRAIGSQPSTARGS